VQKAVLQIILLSFAASGFSVANAAEQNTVTSGVIYRCRTQDGGTAFVSKLDATLSDCTRVSDYPVKPNAAVSPNEENRPHVETAEEHAIRLKRVMAEITQWCMDRAGKQAKPKDLQACVQDKFGTYTLLYP